MTERKPKKPRKKGSRGPEKGGEFERLICRALTTWVNPKRENGKPELFWRSATSGAKATQDTKAGRKANQGGDIIAIQDEVLGTDHFWITEAFSIECKDRKDYGNLDLMFLGKGDFLKWWRQAVTDAKKADKIPLLICKKLRGEILIAFPSNKAMIRSVQPSLNYHGQDGSITICLFVNWLTANPALVLKAGLAPRRRHLKKAGQ